MARTPKPRYRTDRDVWVVQVGGKQHRLAEGHANKKLAEQRYHKIMAASGSTRHVGANLTVNALFDLFHDRNEIENEPSTRAFYRGYLGSFATRYGEAKAEEIKPFHVTQWVHEHKKPLGESERKVGSRRKPWSDSTTRGAITAVKAAFSWAKAQHYIGENPLAEIKRPEMDQRQVVLSAEQIRAVYQETTDQEFRDYLDALHESGARPSEIARVEAAHLDFDLGLVVLPPRKHKTGKKTRTPRTFPLTPKLEAICRRLAAKWPRGPIFRNTEMNPWTGNSIRCRIRKLRESLDLPVGGGVGSIRHLFADDALEAGVPIKTVAELLGHTDTKMVDRHYSRLRHRKGHLREALAKFRPTPKPDRGPDGEPQD